MWFAAWNLGLMRQMPVADHSRPIVLSSGEPLKYLCSTARKVDLSGAALIKSVVEDRSLMASIRPKFRQRFSHQFPSLAVRS